MVSFSVTASDLPDHTVCGQILQSATCSTERVFDSYGNVFGRHRGQARAETIEDDTPQLRDRVHPDAAY